MLKLNGKNLFELTKLFMKKKISSIQELSNFIDELLEKWYKKFLLSWDLWVWKTEFTKQLAKKIWIKNISSPTYTYINNYDNKLLHWDFYRIEKKEDFLNLWILENIEDFEYICIEWPKFKEFYKNDDFIELNIEKKGDARIINYHL